MTEASPEPDGLAWRRRLARLVLWWERLLPALLPAASVAGLFVCAALLDLPVRLPWWAHAVLLAGTGGAIVVLLWRGLARLVPPDGGAADRRLERDTGLAHRPLAALNDRPVTNDPVSVALWRAHVMRGLAKVRRLRLAWPRPGLAALDRRALRNAVLLGLLVTLVIAGRDAPARLAAAFTPALPVLTPAPGVEVQAWVTAPAYTGVAPLFLKRDHPSVAVPEGAKLTIGVTGGTEVPDLVVDGTRTAFTALDRASFQAGRTLTADSRIAVTRQGRDLAAWDIAVIPDHPPVAAWTEPPGSSETGARIRLPWTVTDDYGVTGLQAELRLTARPDAPALIIPIPLPGGAPKAAHGLHPQDLIAHPWAGLGITARLVARDGAGQTGTSGTAAFDLPERAFHNEIAKALIEIRKGLSLHPEDRTEALAGLDALMQNPMPFGADSGAFLNLSAIYYLFVRNKAPDAIAEGQSRLWDLALHLEEGQSDETARALEVARQAARDAMDKLAEDPSDANKEALEKRLEELRAAIDRHLQAMMQEAERNHEALPFDPSAEQLSDAELDRLTAEAREAAREGRMDEAREKMAELEKLLDRLKQARADKGQGNSQQRQQGRQQMGAAQDMIAREGALLDRAETRMEEANHPHGIPHGLQPEEQSSDPDVQRTEDKAVQSALRNALGEMMQQFGDLTGEIPGSLTEADQAMREAGQRLADGDDRGGGQAEQRAIEALQKGAHDMGRTLAQKFGRGNSGSEEGDGEGFGAIGPPDGSMGMMSPDGRRDGRSGRGPASGPPRRADSQGRDPLGRKNDGASFSDGDVVIPEEAERQRSQAIQDELRRRGAERERPRRELDYIDRLLREF